LYNIQKFLPLSSPLPRSVKGVNFEGTLRR